MVARQLQPPTDVLDRLLDDRRLAGVTQVEGPAVVGVVIALVGVELEGTTEVQEGRLVVTGGERRFAAAKLGRVGPVLYDA